jgi:hypothetical protein
MTMHLFSERGTQPRTGLDDGRTEVQPQINANSPSVVLLCVGTVQSHATGNAQNKPELYSLLHSAPRSWGVLTLCLRA